MPNKLHIPNFIQLAESLQKDIRSYARVYCLRWFDDSFQKQGFTDAAFTPWQKRKEPDRRPGGAILVDTTFLRKSLNVLEEGANSITFGTHVPYARIHNYGGRLTVTQNVRGFHRVRNGKREQVKPHTRKMNALYPERKFIGESKQMMQGLEQWLFNEIENRFKTT